MGSIGCCRSVTPPPAFSEQIRFTFRHSGDMPG